MADLNETLVTETQEVMDLTEEVVKTFPSKGVKVAGCIGLIALGGGLAYKFAIKPLIKKHNDRKAEKEANETVEADYVTVEEDFEEA